MAYKITWKGIEIGTITEKNTDMWYSNLDFQPNITQEAQNFIMLAEKLTLKETRQDWAKGILVEIYWEGKPSYSIVLQYTNQELYVRSHFKKETLEELFRDTKF
jgi:hypothetical protein